MPANQSGRIGIVAVALAAGVSPATVSRAFNHPEMVKAPTRRRIDEAVQALGYIRNRAAQTVYGRQSGTVGLIVPTMTNSIFSEVTQAFSDAVDAAGFAVLIATHGYDLEREAFLLRSLLEHRIDGVALVGLDHQEAVFDLIERRNVPAVAVWNFDPVSRLPCVGADNAEAGRLAAGHLIALGHRRVGLVFPPVDDNERARARQTGALSALAGAGIATSEAWRIEALYNTSVAKRAIIGLLEGPDLPSALVCGNDIIALGAVFAAQRLGLSVPGHISIMGIGDFPGSADLEPGLSTVRIPAQKIGQQAGRFLAETILGGQDAPMLRACLDVELKVRGTTGPPAES